MCEVLCWTKLCSLNFLFVLLYHIFPTDTYIKIQDFSPKEYDCTEEAILCINFTVCSVVQMLLYSLLHLKSSSCYKPKIFKKAATY